MDVNNILAPQLEEYKRRLEHAEATICCLQNELSVLRDVYVQARSEAERLRNENERMTGFVEAVKLMQKFRDE